MIDLFSGGAAGWEHGPLSWGWKVGGVENWSAAIATREANGLNTVHEDVTTFSASLGVAEVLAGSPPCTKYAKAGNSPAHKHLEDVRRVVRDVIASRTAKHAYAMLCEITGDASAALVVEPLRIILEGMPMYVALEQTPTILPVWEEYEKVLQSFGYQTDSGNVDAAWFGVPQNRKRAILLARRDGETPAVPRRGGAIVPMRDALPTRDPNLWIQRSNYSASATATKRTAAERGRTMRTMDQPSVTVTSKVFNWVHTETGEWMPVSVREMTLLQSLPESWKWQGGISEKRQQIGNAVPRLMGSALLRAVTR